MFILHTPNERGAASQKKYFWRPKKTLDSHPREKVVSGARELIPPRSLQSSLTVEYGSRGRCIEVVALGSNFYKYLMRV